MSHDKRDKGKYRIKILLIIFAEVVVLMALAIWLVPPIVARATSNDLSIARTRYPSIAGTRIDTCALCHTGPPNLNPFGAAYLANGRNAAALAAIENFDSDGDTFTNIQEIMALTFPGNPNDFPAPASPTPTMVPPTATSVLPTATTMPPTATSVLPTATTMPPTVTSAPPTATSVSPTSTGVPPTSTMMPPTSTMMPPTSTMMPPTVTTMPPTPTSPPSGSLDLDIHKFKVNSEFEMGEGNVENEDDQIEIRLDVKNSGSVEGQGTAMVVGVQNGVEIYRETITVTDPAGNGHTRYFFSSFVPTTAGDIAWTVSLSDGDPDNDVAVKVTDVKNHDEDDDHDGDDDGDDDDQGGGDDHGGGDDDDDGNGDGHGDDFQGYLPTLYQSKRGR